MVQGAIACRFWGRVWCSFCSKCSITQQHAQGGPNLCPTSKLDLFFVTHNEPTTKQGTTWGNQN